MDGTWKPQNKMIKYVICPSCKQLMKSEEMVKGIHEELCWKCAEI
jgi:hypothetical protein